MIRKIDNTQNEIESIMQLWLKSTIKAHPFIQKEYWKNNYKLVKDIYIPKGDVYVYIKKAEIIGFISILNQEFIGALFVDTNSWGKGIGKKLINFAYDTYGKLSLTVYKDNHHAVNFYEYIGFKRLKEQLNEETSALEYSMYKN